MRRGTRTRATGRGVASPADELDAGPRHRPRAAPRGAHAHAPVDRQRPHRRAGADDVRLPGRGRDPGVRAAARPRPAREGGAAPRGGRGGHRAAGCRHLLTLHVVRGNDRRWTTRRAAVGRLLHRMPASGGPATMTTQPIETRTDLVTIDDISAAALTLRGVAVHTPLLAVGPPERRHYLKPESLQPIGAFKIRGAYVAVSSLRDEERSRGVITYSSGNHAQGVARAARLLGAPVVVVMPNDAPAVKRDRVAADGAEIVVVGTASEERKAVAERIAAERGLSIIPPYDDDRIIAGQGTIGLELVEDLPDLA